MTPSVKPRGFPIGWQFQDGIIGSSLAHAAHDV